MPENSYPRLKNIISLDSLPSELNQVKSIVSLIIDDLYYSNLQSSKSKLGDAAFYNLSLISYGRLEKEIPGTGGIVIVFNPSIDLNNDGEISIH